MTVFIIVGIMVVALGASILYFSTLKATKELKERETPPSIDFVTAFVQRCLERSVIDGLYVVLAQGGYLQFPPDLAVFSFEDETLTVPVYFQKTAAKMPGIPQIQTEVARAAEQFLPECIDDFKQFKKQGYAVAAGDPKAEVILAQRIRAALDYPVTVEKGTEEIKLDAFSVTIPFNFLDKYATIQEYLSQQEKNSGYFLAGELSAAAYEEDFGFGFTQVNEKGSDVLITLSYERLKDEPLQYNFALLFDWTLGSEQVKIAEPSLQLLRIPEWNITTPGIHTLQINAAGESLSFRTDPKSLPIDAKTGVITINTEEFPNDEYLYYVIVNDAEQEIAAPVLININANDGKLPIMKAIGKQTAKAGEKFYYKVEAAQQGELLLFTSDSYLFDLDKKTGEISFTPTDEERGIHSVRIDAENEFGKTWQRFELEIK